MGRVSGGGCEKRDFFLKKKFNTEIDITAKEGEGKYQENKKPQKILLPPLPVAFIDSHAHRRHKIT